MNKPRHEAQQVDEYVQESGTFCCANAEKHAGTDASDL